MDVSQLYMLALRATGVPIAGESADNLFIGQVELKEWNWDFFNKEVKKRYEQRRKDQSDIDDRRVRDRFKNERKTLMERYKAEDIRRFRQELADLERAQADAAARGVEFKNDTRPELRRKLEEAENRQTEALEEISSLDAQKDAFERRRDRRELEKADLQEREDKAVNPEDESFKFKFSKRVDVSTTQLLNVMKAGELMPKVVLTMHQSSVNTPWSLVITVNRVRLIDYKLKVDTSDTMTDMMEDWECEFESFGYVYQNRPHAGLKSMTAGKESTVAARAATQATVRTFMMTNAKFW